MTSGPYQYVINTGVIVPDTSDILAGVQNEYQQVFGADLIVDPSSPQGVLITAETLARSQVVNNNAAVANQINPNIAGGTFLDAIMGFTGVQRIANTPTLVNAQVTGVPGTTLPILTQAATAAGDVFQTTAAVTLDTSGNGTVQFASQASGPIPCAANALVDIVTPVLGWETVTNAVAGTLGTVQQSDQAARAYRLNTLAFQGLSLAAAITSALYAVPGVQSLFFQENTDAAQTINGIAMAANSVYACVNGGDSTAIATALLENKSSGAGWTGGTTVDVVEPASGQTYAVKFDTPTPVPVLVKVTIAINTAPTDATADVTQAVLDYAAGLIDGVQGLVVGGNVSSFEIGGAITSEFPGIYIRSVQTTLASAPSDWSSNELVIAVNAIATIASDAVTVVTS